MCARPLASRQAIAVDGSMTKTESFDCQKRRGSVRIRDGRSPAPPYAGTYGLKKSAEYEPKGFVVLQTH